MITTPKGQQIPSTPDEVAEWTWTVTGGQQGSPALSAPGITPEATTPASTASPAAGTTPQADVFISTPATLAPVARPEPEDFGLTVASDLSAIDQTYDQAVKGLQSSVDQMNQANQAGLRGEISGDVAAQVRMQSAEKADLLGISGQAGQGLTARDLGLTSLSVQQQAIQTQGQISGLQQSLAAMAESKRQFEQTYTLSAAQFAEATRQFDTSTQMGLLQLEQARREFNAGQNLSIIGLQTQLAAQRATVQYNYAAQGIDSANVASDFNNLIAQLDALLATSPGT